MGRRPRALVVAPRGRARTAMRERDLVDAHGDFGRPTPADTYSPAVPLTACRTGRVVGECLDRPLVRLADASSRIRSRRKA
jgi:hypothetical protein